jgi:lipopolysaccharide export system protein LptA
MPRVAHIAASFAIVLMAYWAYALVAVPWIEPAADPGPSRSSSTPTAMPLQDQRGKEWAALFPPGAWERKDPEVLTIDQAQLLMPTMQNYESKGNGRVQIRPCTIIFTPEGIEDPAERIARSVVMEAPDGAIFQFDPSFDPSKLKTGQFRGGELPGRVTIRSRGKSPDGQDSLNVVTRNVKMTEYDITTPEAVEFRLGPHFGRGRQLHMRLLPREDGSRGNQPGANIGGLEYVEIRRLERLHLDLGKVQKATPQGPAPGLLPPGTVGGAAGAAGTADEMAAKKSMGLDPAAFGGMPLEITCRGPFCFNVVQQTATFQDRVEVLQVHSDGQPNDRLTCNLLSLLFRKKAGRTGAFDLEPQRIEAIGTPAVLVAPSRKVQAVGERLQYDMQAKWIVLSGGREVWLQRDGDELHARSVRYEAAAEPGRVGRVEAVGPGWLRRQPPDQPDQQLEARWGKQLLMRPEEQNQVIRLTGGAELKFQAINRLSADEIHFWLLEKSQGPSQQSKLQPDRMLARSRVKLDSPQFSGAVDELQAWFKPRAADPGDATLGNLVSFQPSPAGPSASASPLSSPTAFPQTGRGSPAAIGSRGRPDENNVARQDGGGSQRHLEIHGRRLLAEILLPADLKPGGLSGSSQAELSELTVEDNVALRETRTARPDERPLLITGKWLKVSRANRPDATAKVLGQPAYFEGRGLSLTGSNLNLDGKANHLWIDGPGRMEVLVAQDMEGKPLATPRNLQIDWQLKMDFDGRKTVFQRSVVAADPTHRLKTEVMEVQFQQPIRLTEARMQQQPQIEQIVCDKGVAMESYSVDPQQPRQLASLNRMQVADLAINMRPDNGALRAGGPGWVVNVSRGTGNVLGDNPKAAKPKPQSNQLSCMHVRFQGYITGNVHRHEATFHDQVRAVYGPVDSWSASLDTDDPKVLGPDGMVLHCDELSVVDMAPPNGKERDVELAAVGNAVAEGSDDTFTARAARISYDQKKDLLVLEGDGRTDAELLRQQTPGGLVSKTAGQKILYLRKDNFAKIEGARSLEFNQTPGDRANSKKTGVPLQDAPVR